MIAPTRAFGLGCAARRLACLLAVVAAAAVLPATASAAGHPDYRILVFTPRDGDAKATAGVKAIRDLGKSGPGSPSSRAPTLPSSRGRVCRRRRLPRHPLGDRDRAGLAVPDRPARHARDRRGAACHATIKVADRVHDASKSLPEHWSRTDRFYNFTSNVRGEAHVLATVDETTYTGGTMGVDHPVAWCKDYQGGRSFYTAGGDTAATLLEPTSASTSLGAIDWAAGVADPVYSDCGATVLANYQQVKITRRRTSTSRSASTSSRTAGSSRPPATGACACTTRRPATSDVIAKIPVYTVNEDGLYGPAVDNDFATNKWVYLYYSPLQMEGISQSGVPYPATTSRPAPRRRRRPTRRLGPVEGLLPALALQVRRRRRAPSRRGSTWRASRRS